MSYPTPTSETADAEAGSRSEQPAPYLQALSGVLIFSGTLMVTIAAIIKWWPVSIVLLVAAAVVFWTVVAITAKDDPTQTLDLRDVV